MAKGGVNVEVLGDKELQRRFKALEGVGQADILEAVLHAVAEPIRDAASSRAPRRTGNLAEHIVVETLEKRKDECVVGIGPAKDAYNSPSRSFRGLPASSGRPPAIWRAGTPHCDVTANSRTLQPGPA